MRTLIYNATIVNGGISQKGSVVIENEFIAELLPPTSQPRGTYDKVIDATGCYLLPGVIDDHVHFREPGLTKKGDILSESRAAAAGGVTSIMDMPNTTPATTTLQALEEKQELLDQHCMVNHACYFGATNNNYTDFRLLDTTRVCGIKLFMGSSTGNLLVDREESLRRIFGETDLLIATHCEDQIIIGHNIEKYKRMYGGNADKIPVNKHPFIRNGIACYNSSHHAVRLANEMNTRLHVLHVSTEKELLLFSSGAYLNKRVTCEVCVPHLLFSSADYAALGARIKCNPAVKTPRNTSALRKAIKEEVVDVIATDHAPHLLSEKTGGALRAASGMPMVQFSLISMLELMDEGHFSIGTLVGKMCHAPARIFHIEKRGFIQPKYFADLVLVKRVPDYTLTADDVLSKCGWSPLEGQTFRWKVQKTFINGHTVFDEGALDESYRGEALRFNAPII
jgi:dihydroorotase